MVAVSSAADRTKDELLSSIFTSVFLFGAGLAAKSAWDIGLTEYKLSQLPDYIKVNIPFAKAAAKRQKIRLPYFLALIQTESEWDPFAHRVELRFYRRYIEGRQRWAGNPHFEHPEIIASSFGLTQIMYTTAVQMGFPEDSDYRFLYDPEYNLNIGAKYFRLCLDTAGNLPNTNKPDLWNAYIKYNAGLDTDLSTASQEALRNVERYISNLTLIMDQFSF